MSEMTLEQVAREWLEKTGQVFWNGVEAVVSERDVADLITLLSDQRTADARDAFQRQRIAQLEAEVARLEEEAEVDRWSIG